MLKTSLPLPALLLLGATLASESSAQPSRPGNEVKASFSDSGAGDVDGYGLGEVEIGAKTWEASATHSFQLGDKRYAVGVTAKRIDIDAPDVIPLPDTLDSLSLDLTAHWQINQTWALNSRISTGFYGDDEIGTSDALNVSGLFFAIWKQSPSLTWFGGFRADPMSDIAVLPLIGARWQIDDRWTATFGAPRTEVSYQLSPSLSFFGGASVDGGTYTVDDSRISRFNRSNPDGDTTLEYVDVRVGAGVRQTLSENLRLEVEVGSSVIRRWEYETRDVTFKPEGGLFGTASLVFEF